jgi:hypothetical protein
LSNCFFLFSGMYSFLLIITQPLQRNFWAYNPWHWASLHPKANLTSLTPSFLFTLRLSYKHDTKLSHQPTKAEVFRWWSHAW